MRNLVCFLLALLGCAGLSAKESSVAVSAMQCEYLTDPLGIDTPSPRLMWKLASDAPGACQRAYRVSVASSPERLAAGTPDVWDSGKTKSGDQMVEFTPSSPLQSHRRYWWSVEIWDGGGAKSVSPAAWFETGKMSSGDWDAQWITDGYDRNYRPAPMFRREFTAGSGIVSARAYVCGLGYYEMFLNGERVGDHLLDPGYTDFSKRVLYVTYDVTDRLTSGENCVGFVLGGGWYNNRTPTVWNFQKAPWRDRQRLLCELRIAYGDGTTQIVRSDGSWKTSTGPLLYDNLYTGVIYDARLEQPGWNRTGFDDSAWSAASVTRAPAPVVEAQTMAPVRAAATVPAVSFVKLDDTTYVYDLGINFAGVARLKVKGPAGTKVSMRHGEMLDGEGRVDQRNINMHLRPVDSATEISQYDVYILKGDGVETFTPPFTYHGFQYVEVTTSVPLELSQGSVEGVVMHSDVRPVGDFRCSNELLNKIFDISKRSYLSNLFGIPTDCPHREKNGWMADGYMVQEAGMINYDSRNIYAKWVRDMIDAQEANGNVPGIVPTSWAWDSNWAGPMWDAAIFIVPKLLYEYTGDVRAMQEIYPAAVRYLQYLKTRETDKGTIDHGLGDWLFYKAQTPVDFMATCFYYWDNRMMAEMARLTGRVGDAAPYLAKAEELKELINREFFNADDVSYSNRTQLSYALPLYVGIVPEEYRKELAANLERSLAANGYSLDFGFIGSLVVPQVLTDYGYADAVYRLATKTTLPSWGYWIEQCGATSLFETWDVMRNIGDASRNHPSMGAISAWMYKALCGINVDPADPAFRHVNIRPNFVDGLTWAEASYDSQRGTIRSGWRREGGRIVLDVQLPPNVTATVTLPAAASATDGRGSRKGIRKEKTASGAAYRIGSGTYRFTLGETK